MALPWARQAFAWYLLPVRPFLEQLYCDRCLAVFWRPRWLRWPLLPSLAVPEYSEAEEITLAYPAKLGGRGVARKRKMTG